MAAIEAAPVSLDRIAALSGLLVRPDMEQSLTKVVGGILAFVMEFDGPATAYIGSTCYVTLCSHGIKAQGESVSEFYGWRGAIEAYATQLAAMLKENDGKQLAWRVRPELRGDGPTRYYVYSRLAFV